MSFFSTDKDTTTREFLDCTRFYKDPGVRKHYDACSESHLSVAKEFYKERFIYVGSSYTYFINGVKNTGKKLTHYFIYK